MIYDFDTGYVQGMSDLASPLLYIMQGDTCKAFWFFAKIMEFTVSIGSITFIKNDRQMFFPENRTTILRCLRKLSKINWKCCGN